MERVLRLVVLPAALTAILVAITCRLSIHDDLVNRGGDPHGPDLTFELGFLVAFGAAWIAMLLWWAFRHAERPRRNVCPSCGYSRDGLEGRVPACPECGRRF